MFKNIFAKILKYKIYSGLFAVVAIGGGFLGYKTFAPSVAATQYVTAPVEKGVLTVSIGGSGQVANSNKIDIKAQASGKLLSLVFKSGTEVKENDILMKLDAKDAYKTVRDAQVNYESAVLSYNKLTQATDSFSLLQSQNSLDSAKNSLEKLKLSQASDHQTALDNKQKAEDNLAKGYEDSYNTISGAFLQLPTVMSGLDEILNGDQIMASLGYFNTNTTTLHETYGLDESFKFQGIIDSATSDYALARNKFDLGFIDYKSSNRYSDHATVDSLLNKTLEMTKSIAQAAKSESNMLDSWVDARTLANLPIFAKVTEYQGNLSSFIGQTNAQLSSLLSAQRSLQDNKDAIKTTSNQLQQMEINQPLDLKSAEQNVKQQEASLQKLQAGADPLDIRSQQISLQQRLNSLNDARETLANYTIRAPLDGILAQVNVNPKDLISSGTIVATIITKQQVADISLNEVDVAKIKAGQKVNLTFDAVNGLSISGSVASIDGIGTVTQGVVNYIVHLIFDTQDDRIKPGMSVSAHIITDIKTDAVLAPNSAVKLRNGSPYVQLMENGAVWEQPVEIGLSNDSNTEILSGLNEGDLVVTQTITASKTAAAQPSGNLLQSLTGGSTGGAAGGATRQFGGGSAGR